MKDQLGGPEVQYWLVVALATVIKVLTSATLTWWKAGTTVLFAVFAAWVFTDPALHFLDLDHEVYRNPMAAIMALAGEGCMRWLVNVTPEKLWQFWRGKK